METKLEKPTHFAVVFNNEKPSLASYYVFRIFAGAEKKLVELCNAFRNENPGSELVALEELPKDWREELASYAETHPLTRNIGNIKYQAVKLKDANIALLTDYFPKPSRNVMKGFGVYVEALCVEHLKKCGVTHITSLREASEDRRKQLEKLGLPESDQTEINLWLKALRKRVESIKKKN